MPEQLKCDECKERLYFAGERVSPGLYQQVESGHQVSLEVEDFLPADMDGHTTIYVRVEHTWAQIQQAHTA